MASKAFEIFVLILLSFLIVAIILGISVAIILVLGKMYPHLY